MGDQGQKGVQFLEEAQKKLKNSQGFLSSFFGYVFLIIQVFSSFVCFKINPNSIKNEGADPESMKQSICMLGRPIHLKWLKNGEVCDI